MGETNPRLLALLLEDLAQDLEGWGMRAADLATTAAVTQGQTLERVVRALRLAAIAIDKAQQSQEDVTVMQGLVDSVEGRNGDAGREDQELLAEAERYGQKAVQSLAHWTAELQYALAWEARATQRVAKAESDLAQAQAALRSAEYELDRAVDDYNECASYRDDKGRGRNCSSELARVRAAERAVAAAQAWVKEAQEELAAARAELARARARVKCTREAVELATEAVSKAQESIERATDALTAIERSAEACAAAKRATEHAAMRATTAEEVAQHAAEVANRAASDADEAHMYLREMTRAEENAQRMRVLACSELGVRVDHLYRLNRPDGVLRG